jgi:hypothetical protein
LQIERPEETRRQTTARDDPLREVQG